MKLGKTMFRKATRLLGRSDAGQALIETVLVFPLLMLMLIGTVELVRVIYVAIEVSNAAKAAVQFGAQNSVMAADSVAIVSAAKSDGANLASLTVSVNRTFSCAKSGTVTTGYSYDDTTCASGGGYLIETLEVTTSTTFDPLFHLPGLPTSFTLHGHATQEVL